MAKLTPLAKGLIALTILSITAAAAWQLGLKDIVLSGDADPVTDPVTGNTTSSGGSSGSSGSGALGSVGNPLKVSIVSFHGYAPALVANGNSLTTQAGSLFAQKGVNVEFIIQDDIPPLPTIFGSDTAHCAWRTSDFWAQEHPNLRNAGYDAKAVMVVDNTQGADAVIARDPSVQSIEDLAGKSVALLEFTPSHGMLIDAIDNSSLSKRKKDSIKMKFINVDEGTAGVGAALTAGAVDAAVLWDPDLALAVKNTPGAHVIYSTATATNLIYDVIVCDSRHLDNPANEAVFEGFVGGWMAGVDAAEADPDNAVRALTENEEFFKLLAGDEGDAFVKNLFSSLVWTGLEDNARILGLAGGTNHYERVYKRFDGIYRGAGALANPNSPVINPQNSFDYRFINRLLAAAPSAQTEAAKPEFTFSEKDRDVAATSEALLTKPVTVNFKTGSADLTKRAQQTIDEEMVPLIENNGSAYFEVSGNTDSTGSRGTNMRLSKQRAEAAVSYLVNEWEFKAERFVVVGNGPDKPLCDEKNPDSEGLTLEECQAANRSTRLAILSAGN
ncbi:MAG: phosphate ABC transporter substrate-binding/OmpA family protein [Myxococcota bacterium]|nr:phosphate ABC transporter substrate-binding/OmpA family protein [Myxococcota bacterium]